MKISTLELIRMMWRWEEWRHFDRLCITNGEVFMVAEFGLTVTRVKRLNGLLVPTVDVVWECNLLTYFITRPFFYRLVRKLNQRKP